MLFKAWKQYEVKIKVEIETEVEQMPRSGLTEKLSKEELKRID